MAGMFLWEGCAVGLDMVLKSGQDNESCYDREQGLKTQANAAKHERGLVRARLPSALRGLHRPVCIITSLWDHTHRHIIASLWDHTHRQTDAF